ncbi:MAG: hypothetical protein ABSE73_22725 [Planctomycetota bacterium]
MSAPQVVARKKPPQEVHFFRLDDGGVRVSEERAVEVALEGRKECIQVISTVALLLIKQFQHVLRGREAVLSQVWGSDDTTVKQVAGEEEPPEKGVGAPIAVQRSLWANDVPRLAQVLKQHLVNGLFGIEERFVLAAVNRPRFDPAYDLAKA